MAVVMKSTPHRTWVLLLGIAVAIIISVAALVYREAASSSLAKTPQAPSTETAAPSSAPALVIKNLLEKIDLRILQSRSR